MRELLTLVLATGNEGKVLEFRELLHDLPLQIVTAGYVLGREFSVPEQGATFEANAIEKAQAARNQTGLVALADDSGLEVDALGGRPGVRSARFAHDRATDAENNAELLRQLEDVHERSARFRCVLALASPWSDEVQTAEGRCDGTIARAPRGSGGFGYDPLFLVDGAQGRAMAELDETEKNAISHRGRAVRALRPLLVQLIEKQLGEARRIDS